MQQTELDRTGTLLGVVEPTHAPRAQIIGRDGHLALDLGEGDMVALHP